MPPSSLRVLPHILPRPSKGVLLPGVPGAVSSVP